MRFITSIILVSVLLLSDATAQVNGFYRQPDIYGDTIVFSAEGDIWSVPVAGGTATRLTTHDGEESWPYFSPDGSQIAFRASYEGGPDVYVIPSTGGVPKRITWDPLGGSRPVGWSEDSRVMVRSFRSSGLPDIRLSLVSVDSGDTEDVPLSQAAEGSFDDGGTLFFARMPRQGSNSRWYKGGTAQKIWKFGPGLEEAVPLTTDYPGSSRQPNVMDDGKVYFLSDRKDAMNVWSAEADGSELSRITSFTSMDIQELAGDGIRLVFRKGADIWTLFPATGKAEQVDIWLLSDDQQAMTDWETKPEQFISDADISHDGTVVSLVSRGELFVASVGNKRIVHASRNSGIRYRNAVFTVDSTHVYGLSDRSGELEWWKLSTNGSETPTQITDGPAILRGDARPSPDGKKLTHTDYDGYLWLVDLTDGSTKRISESQIGGPGIFSPDSRFIVYSRGTSNQLSALFLFDTADGSTKQLTSDRFTETSPTFSADGNWLFFVSNRTWKSTVGSPWGERAPQPHFEKTAKMYALPLKKGLVFPLSPANELDLKSSPTGERRWDLGHLLREFPVPAGSLRIVGATDKRVLYRDGGNLMAIDLKAGAKPIQILKKPSNVTLSGNRKKLMVRKGSTFYVIGADTGKDTKLKEDNKVNLKGWKFPIDKRAEWTGIYNDMWRLHRDYFWDPNMGGVDWQAMREKYAVLLPRVGSREALADLQRMLVSELSLMHSNARGGDVRKGDNAVSPASLGGVFRRDEKTKGFKLVHRYEADPDLPELWSPLAHPDVQIEEGSVVLSVNGASTSEVGQIGQLLMDQAGKQVRLSVLGPAGNRRDVVITPISGRDEFSLRYHEWEYTRRRETEDRSNGSIGYVHLRAMGSADIGQWTREFYSQTDKQGLIVDVRHNNGGNIDSWVLSQLLRKTWSNLVSRAGDHFDNMQFSYNGHIVILVDERSASDGEAVADGFMRLGLGTSIGMRTWGGEVWLSGSNTQVDGGVARASEYGVYGQDRTWLIEGWGFVPEIEVDNLPHATFKGHDAQLEAAIAHLQKMIAQDPRVWPEPPPYPVLIPGSGFPTPWHKK